MRTWGLLAAVVATGCVSSVNPDQGKFSCASTSDCGAGWECRAQLAGGGRCFKLGVCSDRESCNGLDDDCNGAIDETFDVTSDSANCGECGHACGQGNGCRASVCREENCGDGLDNDHNGLTDCADDACRGQACLSPDGGQCGALLSDGGVYDGGAGVVRACFSPEQVCDNGLDDDGDGLIDCRDPNCLGRPCASGVVCVLGSCG